MCVHACERTRDTCACERVRERACMRASVCACLQKHWENMGFADTNTRPTGADRRHSCLCLMFMESLRAIQRSRSNVKVSFKRKQRNWIHALPFKMRFRTSGLYISVIPPLIIGLAVGVLAAIMGVGGGFVMVPAMIYILGMPTKVVVGTSLFPDYFCYGLHHITSCDNQLYR